MNLRLLWLVVLLTLAACASYQPVAAGTPPLTLKASETRTIRLGKFTIPAGQYVPDFRSDNGIFYLAPSSVITSGLGLSGTYRGGLFVPAPSAKDQRQGIWIQTAPGGTALEAVLVRGNQTTIYRFDDPVKF